MADTPTAVLWLRDRAPAGESRWHRPAGSWLVGKPCRMACGVEHTVDYAVRSLGGPLRPTCPGCSALPREAS